MQNKVQLIKQSSKIQQAASYQVRTFQTLVKSERKRKVEEESNDVIIDEANTTVLKKPKYYCEFCELTFNTSNSLCQHRRTNKHLKNQ